MLLRDYPHLLMNATLSRYGAARHTIPSPFTRYDFSITVQAGEPLYATVEECHALLDSCNESYRTNGGIYGLYGFFSDVTCKRDIPYSFKVTSDMNAYYYCK